MPQIQTIDTTQAKQEPTGVQEFFSKLGMDYKDNQDQIKIGKILKEANQNKDHFAGLMEAKEKLNSDFTLSPSKRMEASKQINESQKMLVERHKALNAQVKGQMDAKKEQDKVAKEQEESETILVENGFDKDRAKELSQTLSPAEASKIAKDQPEKEYGRIRVKAVSDYVNSSLEHADAIEEQQFAIDEARQAIRGDVAGPGFDAVLKNNAWAKLMIGLTPDESSLITANKKLLEGTKGLFGPKPTEREIMILLNDMLPAIGKTQEANEVGLNFIEKVNDMKRARYEIVDRLTNGGQKYVANIQQLVNEEMKPIAEALRNELREANEAIKNPEGKKEKPTKNGAETFSARAPNGVIYNNMTQAEIDSAADQGVHFERI